MFIKNIIIHNIADLNEVINSPIFIGCESNLQNKETEENMWILSLDPQAIKNVAKKDLENFASCLLKKRKEQLLEQNIVCPVIFYMWFDEMAAQLRFNMISDFNKKLPFGCSIEIVNSPQIILEEFVQSHYHEGISWNEFNQGEDDSDGNDDPFTLKVFVVKFNNGN